MVRLDEKIKFRIEIKGNNTNPSIDANIENEDGTAIQYGGMRVIPRYGEEYIDGNGRIDLYEIENEIKRKIVEKTPQTKKELRETVEEVMKKVEKEIEELRDYVREYDNVEMYYQNESMTGYYRTICSI